MGLLTTETSKVIPFVFLEDAFNFHFHLGLLWHVTEMDHVVAGADCMNDRRYWPTLLPNCTMTRRENNGRSEQNRSSFVPKSIFLLQNRNPIWRSAHLAVENEKCQGTAGFILSSEL